MFDGWFFAVNPIDIVVHTILYMVTIYFHKFMNLLDTYK